MTNLLHHRNEGACTHEQADATLSLVFSTLIYTVFQPPRESDAPGIVVVIGSASPCKSVTYVTRAIAAELSKWNASSVAGINARFLRKLHEPTMDAFRESVSKFVPESNATARNTTGTDTSSITQELRSPWEGNWKYRRDCINLLRSEFDHTVIDCPSLKESSDLLSMAPFVDGVILVIEANKTRRDELRQAEHKIAAVRGKLLGYLLTNRTYEIPGWLYRKL